MCFPHVFCEHYTRMKKKNERFHESRFERSEGNLQTGSQKDESSPQVCFVLLLFICSASTLLHIWIIYVRSLLSLKSFNEDICSPVNWRPFLTVTQPMSHLTSALLTWQQEALGFAAWTIEHVLLSGLQCLPECKHSKKYENKHVPMVHIEFIHWFRNM